MAVIIGGEPEAIPGMRTRCWIDDSRITRLRYGEDCRRRVTKWVRGIVLHTTKGIPGGTDRRPQVLHRGLGPNVDAGVRCTRFWSTGVDAQGRKLKGGAHLIVDQDGEISCCADLLLDAAYHAGVVNEVTIGIEVYQSADAGLYADQLAFVVRLCDWLTRRFGIQRQIPTAYRGGPLKRLTLHGGRNFVGIYGHRDCDANRGMGDPGNYVMDAFRAASYEVFDIEARADLEAWAARERALGLAADGIPGMSVVAELAKRGRPHGMWISRPGDQAADPPRIA
jgi:hypothetical protein